MKKIKKPLKFSVLKGCILVFSIICVVLTTLNYFSHMDMMYKQYKDHIRNILISTVCDIDVDDLAECIRTGKESEKYHELQIGLDKRKDNSDMHYLYIIIPLNTNETDNMQNVIAAMSKEEYEESPEPFVKLNSLTGDDYSSKTAKAYLDAYQRDEISYFNNSTEFGDDYTGMYPLIDSKGNKVAALCVDIETSEIYAPLISHLIASISVTIFVGALATLLFHFWIKRHVLNPIETLERSLSEYTENGLDSNSPESLKFEMPDIHTGNEIESLANKIVLMSEALQVTVINMLNTEQKLVFMSIVAHKDGLTNVGNKAAYENSIRDLQKEINEGKAEFGIVMGDINRLKYINDNFGHEKGDDYIKRCCSILCGVFAHSPVFRIGGDEFVVLLRGRDYGRREELLAKARRIFEESESAMDKNRPWENCSMALGMTVYDPATDKDVKTVLDRADKQMYEVKSKMHMKRGEL